MTRISLGVATLGLLGLGGDASAQDALGDKVDVIEQEQSLQYSEIQDLETEVSTAKEERGRTNTKLDALEASLQGGPVAQLNSRYGTNGLAAAVVAGFDEIGMQIAALGSGIQGVGEEVAAIGADLRRVWPLILDLEANDTILEGKIKRLSDDTSAQFETAKEERRGLSNAVDGHIKEITAQIDLLYADLLHLREEAESGAFTPAPVILAHHKQDPGAVKTFGSFDEDGDNHWEGRLYLDPTQINDFYPADPTCIAALDRDGEQAIDDCGKKITACFGPKALETAPPEAYVLPEAEVLALFGMPAVAPRPVATCASE